MNTLDILQGQQWLCGKCKEPVFASWLHNPETDNIEITFKHHGEIELYTLDNKGIRRLNELQARINKLQSYKPFSGPEIITNATGVWIPEGAKKAQSSLLSGRMSGAVRSYEWKCSLCRKPVMRVICDPDIDNDRLNIQFECHTRIETWWATRAGFDEDPEKVFADIHPFENDARAIHGQMPRMTKGLVIPVAPVEINAGQRIIELED